MSVMQLESAYTDGCLCIRYTGDLDHHAARAAFRETEAFIEVPIFDEKMLLACRGGAFLISPAFRLWTAPALPLCSA